MPMTMEGGHFPSHQDTPPMGLQERSASWVKKSLLGDGLNRACSLASKANKYWQQNAPSRKQVVRAFAYGALFSVPYGLCRWGPPTWRTSAVARPATPPALPLAWPGVHSKVSLVLINHARLQNVHWIVENMTAPAGADAARSFQGLVDQVIVWDDPHEAKDQFNFDHPMVDIVRGIDLHPYKQWGLMGRFWLALSRSKNEQILIQDDDEQLFMPALMNLVQEKAHDPDRLVCSYGRDATQPNMPYGTYYYSKDVPAPSHPSICLTKVLLTDRRFCLEVTRWMERMDSAVAEGEPKWNGEDIAHSLTATHLTGKLPTVLPIDPRYQFVLPAPHGINDVKLDKPKWDHRLFRVRIVSKFSKLLGLSGSDLLNQPYGSTGVLPSRLGPLTSIPGVKTWEGRGNICIASHQSTTPNALETAIEKNHRAYAAKHKYTYRTYAGRISGDELLDGSAGLHTVRGGALNWQKIPALKNMLKAGKAGGLNLCTWIMWMDPMAVFTHFEQRLEPLVDQFGAQNETNMGIFARRNDDMGFLVVDSDIFFVRNNMQGFRMLETVAGMYHEYKDPLTNGFGGASEAFQDFVLQRSPSKVKAHLSWKSEEAHVVAGVSVAPPKTFKSLCDEEIASSWADGTPCLLTTKLVSSNLTWKLAILPELKRRSNNCPDPTTGI